MDVLSKIISIILIIVMLFFLPLQHVLEHDFTLMEDYVEEEVIEFVDEIRMNGHIDIHMYESFLTRLNKTQELFHIEIEHFVPKLGTSISTINEADINFASAKNKTILPRSNKVYSHTHTDACYDGEKHIHTSKEGACYTWETHTHSGNISSGGPCYSPIYHAHTDSCYHSHKSDCYHKHTSGCYSICNGSRSVYATYNGQYHSCGASFYFNIRAICDSCGVTQIYGEWCNYCGAGTSPSDVNRVCKRAILSCDKNSSTIECGFTTSSLVCGKTTGTIQGYYLNCNKTGEYKLTCGKAEGKYYKGDVEAFPVCHKIIVSLSPTNSYQVIYKGDSIISEAIATYLDGHIEIVSCSSDYDPNKLGNQKVNLTYGNKNCIADVLVKPNITRIEIEPEKQTINRYQEPNFTVKAIYEDGTEDIVTSYVINDFDNEKLGKQDVTISYTEAKRSVSEKAEVNVIPMIRTCPLCGEEYLLDEDDFDMGCLRCYESPAYMQVSPQNISVEQYESLDVTVTITFKDGHTEYVSDWSSNYDSSKLGYQEVTITYGENTCNIGVTVTAYVVCNECGNKYILDDDGNDPGCSICKETLVSIKAMPEQLILNKGEGLGDIVVTGYYRDGSEIEIKEWTSDFKNYIEGKQQVTIYYNNQFCTITVDVLPESEVDCPICGESYIESDNPWGCPICIETLSGIEVSVSNEENKVIYGQSLELRVVLIYRDGHRQMIFSGWEDNFDPYTYGEQIVTVSYKDKFDNIVSCNINIIVLNDKEPITCDNGHSYYLDNFPEGCPYCAADSGDKIETYYTCNYTDHILNHLYDEGIYYLNTRDYITVKVIAKKEGSIYSFGVFRKREKARPITYGGEVE